MSEGSIVVGDAEYLKALSGYKQRASVAALCTRNHIKFFRNGQGWPVTTEAALDKALSPRAKNEPDWRACDNRARVSPPPNRPPMRPGRRSAKASQTHADDI
jgi:hypothetical protein